MKVKIKPRLRIIYNYSGGLVTPQMGVTVVYLNVNGTLQFIGMVEDSLTPDLNLVMLHLRIRGLL